MLRVSAKWITIYVLEAVAVLLAVVIFGVGATLWRLSSGPVSLDFLREDVQVQLATVFEGDFVALGELEARFDTEIHSLVLMARDVTVAENSGEVVARAPLIEAGLALDELLFGRLSPTVVNVVGGSVSIVRRADGAVGAGLGSVDRVSAQARLPERGGDDSASLFELLRNPAGSNSMFGRLRQLNIEHAAVRIVDGITGIAWLIDDAGVMLDRDEDQIRAEIGGRLATPSGFAPIDIRLQAGASLNSLLLEAHAENLSLASIAPDNGSLSILQGLDAPLSLDLSVNAFRDSGIRSAALDLEIGRGLIVVEGRRRDFEKANLSLSFDPIQGELVIAHGEVLSDVLSTTLSGRMFDFGQYVGALPTQWQYELDIGRGIVDFGPLFELPPVWASMNFSGQVNVSERQIIFDRLDVDLGPVTTRFEGEAFLSQVDDGAWYPNLRLEGVLEGDISPETVLAYWPVSAADGARDWVETGIVSGRFYNARFDIDLDADSIAERQLDNDRLTLSFDFEDAVVAYVSTMTPIVEARGSAVLRGNAFEVDMEYGRIRDLVLSEGFVDMPRLNPKGAMARYGGHVTGSAQDVLRLIDEEPLGFPTDYGIDPNSIGGEGVLDFELGRAMLSEVDAEDIPFSVEADFSGVTLNIPGTGLTLENGEVHLIADQDELVAEGDGLLLDTPLQIRWREDLAADDGIASTSFEVSANMGARALDAFGVPARRFLDGYIQVDARAISDGLDIQEIDVDASLLDATLEAPGGVWLKEAGVPGMAGFTLSTNDEGNYVLEEFLARSEGLEISANAEITKEGRLISAEADRIHVEGLVEMSGRLVAPREEGQAFMINLSGQYLDAREFIPHMRSLNGEGEDVPLSLSVDVGRLMVTDESVFEDFSVIWRGEEAGVRAFSLSGRSPEGPFHASFGAPEEGAEREFRLEAQSLGRLTPLAGLTGYASGGQISVLGEAPPLGVEGPLIARVEIQDLTLVRVPILARLLAAGSFEGLAALLNGDGISFETIDGDIMLEDGLLTLRDARATGASLGVTAAGTVDFTGQTTAIDGNLAPSYVLNSLLGEVPLIGDMLVSRPGEGVFGITYSVEGPFDGLTVFANPLSALAPGVLRRIFEGTAAERAARNRAEEAESEAISEQPETTDDELLPLDGSAPDVPEIVNFDPDDPGEN